MDTKNFKFESLLNSWTMRNPNLALVTQDGLTLISRTQHATDLCSLPIAMTITQKYLKLKDGDLAICNDPYAGGSLTSQITLVTGVAVGGTENLIMLIGTRISTRPRMMFGKTVEEEGLKIPPTPLGSLEQPTDVILEAIASHPMAPDDFLEHVRKGLIQLQIAKNSFLAALRVFDVDVTRSLCQAHTQYSHEATKTFLSEFSHGHSEVQWLFEDGEKLRLKIENTGSRLTLDFSGTGLVEGFHLNEAQVFGCAIRTLELVGGHRLMVNSGTLLAFNIMSPQNSLVSSQAPLSTTLGVLVGSQTICDLIARALHLLHPKRKTLNSNSAATALSFQFQNRSFFDLLQNGSFASLDKKGEAAIDTWNENTLSPSVEDIEARFPLEILSLKKRAESGGAGDNRGGDGVLKTYRLLEPAKLRWFSGYNIKAENHTGLGHPSEIIIKVGAEEVSHRELKGQIDLPTGAVVTVLTRGGQGFVKPD